MSLLWQRYNTPHERLYPAVFEYEDDSPPRTIRPTHKDHTVRAQAAGNAAPGTINPPTAGRVRRRFYTSRDEDGLTHVTCGGADGQEAQQLRHRAAEQCPFPTGTGFRVGGHSGPETSR